MDKALELVKDLIAMEIIRDTKYKQTCLAGNKAHLAVGESAMLFHLRALEELLEQEDKRLSSVLVPNDTRRTV
jgi:hypothetical protein